MRYYSRLYGLARSLSNALVDDILRRVNLADASDARVKTYSLGMKRRLAIAGALLPDPELMILDEPSLGLDPEGMAFIRALLREFHSEGRTVFLSSHLLGEVEKLCTQVGVLQKGRLLRVDTPQALVRAIERQGSTLEVETRGVEDPIAESLARVAGVVGVEVQGTTLLIRGSLDDQTVAEITRVLVTAGVDVLSSRRLEHDLEQAFLELTGAAK
jgi:ABC-2 type transport system ATP-binding protein